VPYSKSNPMLSRSNVLTRARELKNYRFSGYIRQVNSDQHIIRFVIMDFEKQGFHASICTQDFLVTECEGCLSAVSLNGQIHIEKMT